MVKILNVLVWDENPAHVPAAVYPAGIRGEIAARLNQDGAMRATAVHLDQPGQGLKGLEAADVLIWWGHARHAELEDAWAEAIREQVEQRGLGLIALHSAHHGKPFRAVLGCSGDLGGWREDEKPEQIRVCAPQHPIAAGVDDFTLAHEEMYAAPFAVPAPDCVVFQSFFPAGGEYFPSGLCWQRGAGRVFYFRPGHETCPSYRDPQVGRILGNAARWVAGREEVNR